MNGSRHKRPFNQIDNLATPRTSKPLRRETTIISDFMVPVNTPNNVNPRLPSVSSTIMNPIVLSSDSEDDISNITRPVLSPIKEQQTASPAQSKRNVALTQTVSIVKSSIKPIDFGLIKEDITMPGPIKKNKQCEEYEVEKILTYHKESNGLRFLLKWKGWPYSDSTWESRDSLDCPSIMEHFQIRLNLSKIIKKSCKENERRYYPYDPMQQIHRITQFFKLLLWEDHLNKVCREAGVAPIYVENWIDEECAPPNFRFTQKNIFHKDAISLLKPMNTKFECNCKSTIYCKRNECCSSTSGIKFPYQNNKLVNDSDKIVECYRGCACDRNCPGRLVQRGRQIPIVLFRTEFAGWSVRCGAFIPQGTFVMSYLGEVIGKKEIELRKDATSFMYDIDTATVENPTFTIDSLHQGNEARFVNHSCDPNLKTYGVLTERLEDYETLAFFAIKDIKVGDELTIDYYAHVTEALVEGVPCYCGAKKCRKFLMD